MPSSLRPLLFLLTCLLGLSACHSTAPVPAPEVQVSTVSGTGTAGLTNGPAATAQFRRPLGIAVDGQGVLYIADTDNHCIRKITPAGLVSTLAGSGVPGYADGPAATAQFLSPISLAVDAQGKVYVADRDNNCIRLITPAGQVTTFAGSRNLGYADGPAPTARFYKPYGVTLDAQQNLYVADTENHRIRKITPTGQVSTLAGTGQSGFADGPGTTAQFYWPNGVAVDAQGTVYVADYGTHRVRTITPTGTVSTLAGSSKSGNVDGVGSAAQFNVPYTVAFSPLRAMVYVCDVYARVRQVSQAGEVRNLAGSGAPGYADGVAATAQFQHPQGLAVDAQGNVYVADADNHRIRKITLP